MSDWQLSQGPHRPMWEPVRLVDFEGERLEALRGLLQWLEDAPREEWDDEDLGMYAILDYLFSNATVRLDIAVVHAQQIATANLPDPGPRRKRILQQARREQIIVAVGVAWGMFISPNFPLAPSPEA